MKVDDRESRVMAGDTDDDYYESLATIIEDARSPQAHPFTLQLILQILGNVDAADGSTDVITPEGRHLETIRRVNRMRLHLSEETYKFLLQHFHYERPRGGWSERPVAYEIGKQSIKEDREQGRKE